MALSSGGAGVCGKCTRRTGRYNGHMAPHELRDLDAARQFVVQGLWIQRVVPPTAASVRPALEWALEVAAGGQPLPPVGFVADLGHVLLNTDRPTRGPHGASAP